MYDYLLQAGMRPEEYRWFMQQNLRRHCVMGNDYYETNEWRVDREGRVASSGEVFGYGEITRQYHRRYGLPVMHTETNMKEGPHGDEAVNWLWKQWANVLRVRNDGVPMLGFTWYSLTDQVDWDTLLRQKNGHVNPLGLYDLQRQPRAAGKAYRRLIEKWTDVLPTQSLCLAPAIDMTMGLPPEALARP